MTKKVETFLVTFVFLISSCTLGPKVDELDAQAESSDAVATAESDRVMNRDADVLKKGDILILRLKGLNFENNQSFISKKNLPLLVKVQNLLQPVKSSHIQIEGHTDSHGTKIGNQDLSLRRAEAEP